MVMVYFESPLKSAGADFRVVVHSSIFGTQFRVVLLTISADRHELVPSVFTCIKILARRLKRLFTPGAYTNFIKNFGKEHFWRRTSKKFSELERDLDSRFHD